MSEPQLKSDGAPDASSSACMREWERFEHDAARVAETIVAYYRKLDTESVPVRSAVLPGYLRPMLPSDAPEVPEPLEAVLADVEKHILPGITHWQSPGFYAFFPANSSPPAILGDMLSDALNVIGFSWVASPACTELESVVLDWLARLIGLGDAFLSTGHGGGVIQGTASEATLVALLAARVRTLTERGLLDDEEAAARLVCYASDQAHSSAKKALMVAGLPLRNFRSIPSVAPSYAMDVAALQRAMAEDAAAGRLPCFVCATLGTTSSGAFDDVAAVARVALEHKAWVHVDAAWAGAAFVCEELRGEHMKGVQLVDSFDFNPHKWLRTNFDLSAMYVRSRIWLLRALSITPEYLRSEEYESGFVTDYRDWQVPLGRRFRALKLWFVLRMYGAEALRRHIRAHCALAQDFAAMVRADDRFELPTEPSLHSRKQRVRLDQCLSAGRGTARTHLLSALSSEEDTVRTSRCLAQEYLLGFYASQQRRHTPRSSATADPSPCRALSPARSPVARPELHVLLALLRRDGVPMPSCGAPSGFSRFLPHTRHRARRGRGSGGSSSSSAVASIRCRHAGLPVANVPGCLEPKVVAKICSKWLGAGGSPAAVPRGIAGTAERVDGRETQRVVAT